MQTSTKIKLARTGVLLLIRHRTARKVAGVAGRFVLRRKVRSVQADVSQQAALVVKDPARRNRVIVVVAAAGGTVILLGTLKRRRGAGQDGPPVPPSSPVAPPAPVSATPVATPTDTPPSSTSAPGAPPVPAAGTAADVGEGDDALAARVKTTLFGVEEPIAVSVKANAGVVTLEGAVADVDAMTRLVQDAEAVEGVRAVQSELEIQGAS